MTWIPKAAPKPRKRPRRVTQARGQRTTRTKGVLFPKNVSTARRAFIRRQRCIATGAKTGEVVFAKPWMPATLKALCPYVARVQAAHVGSRGAGHPDEGDMIPLEEQLHTLAGQWGWPRFEQRLGLMSVAEIAQEYEAKFRARAVAIAKARGASR